MPRLREKFLEENKDKWIKLIFASGYQLNCKLTDYDEEVMEVTTQAYNSCHAQKVLVPYVAITTYVPTKE